MPILASILINSMTKEETKEFSLEPDENNSSVIVKKDDVEIFRFSVSQKSSLDKNRQQLVDFLNPNKKAMVEPEIAEYAKKMAKYTQFDE